MKIQAGDTLNAIARRSNTTVAKLLELNPQITDKNKIYAGRELKVPGDCFEARPTTPRRAELQQPSTFVTPGVVDALQQKPKVDTLEQAVVARMPPALRQMYDRTQKDDPALARQLLEKSVSDPRIAQAAEGATDQSILEMMSPGVRSMVNEVSKDDPKAARRMMMSEFIDQVDRRTAPQLDPKYESALVANMPPGLRDTYNQLLRERPNEAHRLLMGLANSPFVLGRGRDLNLANVERDLSPAQRDRFDQLSRADPAGARRMLMMIGLEQFFR